MNESHDMRVCNRSSVEDAEEGTVLSCRVLAWWRQDLLEPSRVCLDLAAVMRVVKVHEGPHLPRRSARDALNQE